MKMCLRVWTVLAMMFVLTVSYALPSYSETYDLEKQDIGNFPLPNDNQKVASEEAAQPETEAAVEKDESFLDTYTFQPGNRIRIRIFPQDAYIKGGDMQVSHEGKIILPLIGKLDVLGKKIPEVEATLREIIDKEYLVDPEVFIEILNFEKKEKPKEILPDRTVLLMGAVKRPGAVKIPGSAKRFSLLQALASAGGFSDVANIKKIKIVREIDGQKSVIRANADSIISGKDPDVELEANDIIHVSESFF